MAPTFYELAAENRRRSAVLFMVVAISVTALGACVGGSLGVSTAKLGYVALGTIGGAGIGASIAVAAGLFSWFLVANLTLVALGARPADEVRDRVLLDVVRELTAALGMPAPRVVIVPDSAVNAFATGRDPGHGVIGVTEGLLAVLDREALQGVIAHELSHIRNLDVRYGLFVAGMVGAIAMFLDISLRLASAISRTPSSRGRGLIVVALYCAAVSAVALLVARIAAMGISREREYLADVTAVEITRNPIGLERALVQIAADPEPRVDKAHAGTRHMFLADPTKRVGGIDSWPLFSTHPSIDDRLARLASLRGIDDVAPRSPAGAAGATARVHPS